MEIKNLHFKNVLWEKSPLKKIQPIERVFDKYFYDITQEEIDWDFYFPGKFVSKKA